ncbi:EpsG family protein [Oceanobacillus oncorhynchi]|uniref:EpsG family protein n=1 Tax=Oceanobacillus oncorhynchi TaxID=545501 RepID=UPI00186646E5
MTVYLTVNVLIVIFGLYFESINSKADLSTYKKRLPNYFFIIPSFILIFIITAFRGDFTTDYTHYSDLFDLYNLFSFSEIFQAELGQEIGYILLSRIIGTFTNNEVYLFIVVSFVTLACFYYQFNKYSVYIWLSVLMFVTVGSLYPSFNIMRQILATAIVFAGSTFLYERKMTKYFLVVLVASLFHTTSLIMFPFYFILNFRLNFKNLTFIFAGSVVLMLFFDNILSFIQQFFYTQYTVDSYGMTGQRFTNAVLPLALFIFSLFNFKKLDSSSTIHRVWFNAVFFNALFSVLSLQVQLVERITHFFSPYAMLLIPFMFSKMKNKHLRFIYIMILVLMLFLYNFTVLSGSEYDPYYFIWDSSQ